MLYQNDDFGKDYLTGLKAVFGRTTRPNRQGSLLRGTEPNVDSQVVTLQAAGADTLVTAATPKFAAQMIRKVPRPRLEAVALPH